MKLTSFLLAFVLAAILGLLCAQMLFGAEAQLTEGDRLLIETTQILGSVAGASDKFSLVQQYMGQRQLVTDYLERQYSGQTVDWSQLPAVLKAK